MSAPADGLGGSLAEELDALDEVVPSRRRLPVVQTAVPASQRVRPRTLSMRRQSKKELERVRALYPASETAKYERPVTRGDCEGSQGPCPWVSCKFNLYLDVNTSNGNIKLNFPGAEVWEVPELCALHIADRGGITLEEVGALVNLTRERIRQVEDLAIARMKVSRAAADLADYMNDDPEPALMRGRALNIRNAAPLALLAASGDIWKGGRR